MSVVNEHLLFVSKHEIILSDRFWNFFFYFFFENWEDKKNDGSFSTNASMYIKLNFN